MTEFCNGLRLVAVRYRDASLSRFWRSSRVFWVEWVTPQLVTRVGFSKSSQTIFGDLCYVRWKSSVARRTPFFSVCRVRFLKSIGGVPISVSREIDEPETVRAWMQCRHFRCCQQKPTRRQPPPSAVGLNLRWVRGGLARIQTNKNGEHCKELGMTEINRDHVRAMVEHEMLWVGDCVSAAKSFGKRTCRLCMTQTGCTCTETGINLGIFAVVWA